MEIVSTENNFVMSNLIDPNLHLPRRGRPASSGGAGGEVVALDRAASILEVLASGEGALLAEVAQRAGLPPSTVHRLLTTLHRRGLVGHEISTGLWTVGPGLFRIGSAYLRIRKLPEIARPIIRALLAEVGETVNVSMIEQDELICVAQAESHAPVRAFFRLGRRLPVHASAAGKAILAAGTDALRRQLLGTGPLERFTPNTLCSEAELTSRLVEIRSRGWATDDEEHTPGMRCVSAAILNEWSEPIGAVSISAPTVRLPADQVSVLGNRVKETALTLSRMYSGQVLI
jgi:IclR family acetate operon transcriptional repressor